MQALLILTALSIPTGLDPSRERAVTPDTASTLRQSADELTPRLRTGSLLFSEGDCLAIRVYTASPYTHVAVVVIDGGQPIVYDSMNGSGVRKQTLASYLIAQCPDKLHIYHPSAELDSEQGRELSRYLEGQLGRSYSVHHHLTGQRAEGVHCAEYVTDALSAIGMLHAERPWRVSPASLQTGITTAGIYKSTCIVNLETPTSPAPEGNGRCQQLWLDTRHCVGYCCDQLAGWFLCR